MKAPQSLMTFAPCLVNPGGRGLVLPIAVSAHSIPGEWPDTMAFRVVQVGAERRDGDPFAGGDRPGGAVGGLRGASFGLGA